MSSFVFELIMYLKYNIDVWGLADVVEANKRHNNATTLAKHCAEAHNQRVSNITAAIESWDAVD